MDFVKDGITSFLERVKSPILFSIIMTFLATNWKPIWFIIWGDGSAIERLDFYEAHTDAQSLYVVPICLGFLIGISGPWLRWIGSYTAKFPTMRYRSIENDQAAELRLNAISWEIDEQVKRKFLQESVEQAELAAAKADEARDLRQVQRAQRIEDAKTINDGSAISSMSGAITDEEDKVNELELSTLQKRLLATISEYKQGTYQLTDHVSGPKISFANGDRYEEFSSRKQYLEVENAIADLLHRKLLQGSKSEGSITLKGYRELEKSNLD